MTFLAPSAVRLVRSEDVLTPSKANGARSREYGVAKKNPCKQLIIRLFFLSDNGFYGIELYFSFLIDFTVFSSFKNLSKSLSNNRSCNFSVPIDLNYSKFSNSCRRF
jgi:hypothetical protein